MSDDLDNDILNDLEEYDWEVNNFEDLTQSDCDHNCSPTPDLDIKIEIDEVDLKTDEVTHNEPEPSTSKASTSLRRTSLVRKTNRIKPQILKVTTKKSNKNKSTASVSSQTTVTSTSTSNTIIWRPATTLVPPIKTTLPLTNPTFTKALNKLRPRPDCQIRIGNEALHMITSPGRNPILNTHTEVDETFGTDLSDKLFWTRKGHNLHSLTAQWEKIDQYCWRLQRYLRLINLGLAIETDQTNSTAFTTLLVNYQDFENNLNAFTTTLKKDLLIDKNGLSAIIKSKGKRSRRRILEDEDEEVQKAINDLREVLSDLQE
jgi:hypothetical protein